MEPYYNISYGKGFEGLANYANELVGGTMSLFFLLFVFIAMSYVLSKTELRLPGRMAYTFLVCLIIAMIMKLFMAVNEVAIFGCIIGLAISLIWAKLDT